MLALAAQSVDVAFAYLEDKSAAQRTVELATAYPGRVLPFRVDVAKHEDTMGFLRDVNDAFGPVGILVNNAGIRRDALFATMSHETWRRVIDVNLHGPFNITRAIFGSMCRRHSGTIVNVGSLSGGRGFPGLANYSAAKAALVGLTKVLAREGGPYGVRCNVVVPGLIRTDMTADVADAAAPMVPLGRPGTPEDVAKVVVFLASDWSAYMTGAEVVVDGGFST